MKYCNGKGKKKRYVRIDRETGSKEIFAIFEGNESEAESDMENLLEDSGTEFITEEEIPDTNDDTHQLLTLKAVVRVESESKESELPPKKKLKAKIAELKWKRQPKFIKTRKCNLEAKILLNLSEKSNPLKIYEVTTDFSEIVQYICEQTNLYAAQNGRDFVTNPEEILAFLGINYILSISKIPNLKCEWSVESYFSNEGARNAMTKGNFMKIFQNIHFTDNQTAAKSDKASKIRVVIRHLNKAFQAAKQATFTSLIS